MAPQFPLPPGTLPPPSTVLSPAPPTISSPAPLAVPNGGMGAMPGMIGAPAAPIAPGAFEVDLTKVNPYIYMPSFSMAIVGSMAFFISSVIHIIQLVKTRSWFFLPLAQAPLIVAAALMARTISILTLPTTGATGPFPVFTLLDMASGTITSIGIIFTYTRVMFWVTPDDKRNFSTLWSPPMWTSFMWGLLLSIGDIAKTVAQLLIERTDPLSSQIQTIATVYQFFVLSGFTFVAYRFMMMSRRWVVHGECEEKDWRRLGWTVVGAAATINVRQIFVVVQLDARKDPMGFFAQHEWVYWATTSFPLFVIFTLFNLSHPGFFLPREYIGFVIKLKAIAAAKKDSQWPLNISQPFPMQRPEMLRDSYSDTRLVTTEVVNVKSA